MIANNTTLTTDILYYPSVVLIMQKCISTSVISYLMSHRINQLLPVIQSLLKSLKPLIIEREHRENAQIQGEKKITSKLPVASAFLGRCPLGLSAGDQLPSRWVFATSAQWVPRPRCSPGSFSVSSQWLPSLWLVSIVKFWAWLPWLKLVMLLFWSLSQQCVAADSYFIVSWDHYRSSLLDLNLPRFSAPVR